MIRALPALALAAAVSSASAACAQEAGWSGSYGGVGLAPDASGAELFVGRLAARGPAVMGVEMGAGFATGLGAQEGEGHGGRLALTGRLGGHAGGTLVYGLAGLGVEAGAGGEAGLILGAGAARRLGHLRLGGEIVHERDGEAGGGDTRLGGRIAFEF